MLDNNSLVTFVLGTNTSALSVTGNLANIGSLKAIAGPGFTNGTYTIFNYGKILNGWGPPALASAPAGYSYSYNTNTPGQVKLVVTLLPPADPRCRRPRTCSLMSRWNAVTGATSYNLKRGSVIGIYPTLFSGLTGRQIIPTPITSPMPRLIFTW